MKTLALLALALVGLLAVQPAGATVAPEAVVIVRCMNGGASAQFQYNGFSPQWHLTANEGLEAGAHGVGKTLTFDGPSTSDVMSIKFPAGTGPVTIAASTVVFGGGGKLKAQASRTVTCRRPPPPPPPGHYDPKAWAQGPCEDPMYRFWFDNRGSNRSVTFTVNYLNFDIGWTTVTRTVAARTRVHTGYHHVAGSTRILIRARAHTLYSRLSAPGGNYGPCPA